MKRPPEDNPDSAGDAFAPPAIPRLVNDDGTGDLVAAKRGDVQAFARLYDRHAAVVQALCRRAIGTRSEAEDAMQETFIRAHQKLVDVDGVAGLRPWLYAIARRVCSEGRRAGRRRQHHEHVARVRAESGHRAEPAADVHAAHREDLDRLTEAIEALPPRERLAIHLYHLDCNPEAAASSALGVSRSGYYKLLARARCRLATLMQEVATP